jgi:uncharacterized membrane protein YqjE
MSEEAGYPISFNQFFRAGFPVMLITVSIITLYMILVFGVDPVFKWVLLGIALFGIIWQISRGRSKGETWASAMVDSESILDFEEE